MATFPPSLADALKPALDTVRSIAGLPALGLRPFTVTVRVRVWSGDRPGVGSRVDYDTVIYNTIQQPGGPLRVPVRVQRLSQKDVIASGGTFTDRMYKVGPVTPDYPIAGGPDGGYTIAALDPTTTNSATEIMWLMTGPDMPGGGTVLIKDNQEATAMHFFVTLRSTGQQVAI